MALANGGEENPSASKPISSDNNNNKNSECRRGCLECIRITPSIKSCGVQKERPTEHLGDRRGIAAILTASRPCFSCQPCRDDDMKSTDCSQWTASRHTPDCSAIDRRPRNLDLYKGRCTVPVTYCMLALQMTNAGASVGLWSWTLQRQERAAWSCKSQRYPQPILTQSCPNTAPILMPGKLERVTWNISRAPSWLVCDISPALPVSHAGTPGGFHIAKHS
jgi:hypothetical protein